jgi:hypothetical protein
MNPRLLAQTLTCIALVATSTPAIAGTILKAIVNSPNAAADTMFDGTYFHSVDDGIAATPGQLNTGLTFTGILDSVFLDIPSAASISFSAIKAHGAAETTVLSPGVIAISQKTYGGAFSIYDVDNATLLLSGTLTGGEFVGSSSPVAGFRTTGLLTYTGGTVRSQLASNLGSMSIALSQVMTGSNMGLRTSADALNPFSANVTLQFDSLSVPEPSSAMTFGILVIAIAIRWQRPGRR